MGSPDDCKPCKCPTAEPTNNFSPVCEATSAAGNSYDRYAVTPEEYVCTACPRGYDGPHCERYAIDFF